MKSRLVVEVIRVLRLAGFGIWVGVRGIPR